MTLLTVNEDRCKRDGICVQTCPAGLIEIKDAAAYPTMIAGGEELCLHCGHCVAVCPRQAMDHAAIKAEACPPIRKELKLSPEQAEQFLRARRSIRVYRPETVARDLLSRVIHIARYAPSGHNMQPVQWLVIHDPQQVRHLAGIVVDWMRALVKEQSPLAQMLHMDRVIESWEAGNERIFRGAPHVIVTHAPQDNRAAQSACVLALGYLELMAPTLGLGACWAGYFNAAALFWPPMMEALALPPGHAVFGALMIGYPKFTYHRMPLRNTPDITWR